MSDNVFEWVSDCVSDALDGFHVGVPMPPPGRFFARDDDDPDAGEFEPSPGVDRGAVERTIRNFHRRLLELFAAAGVPGGDEQGYVVLRDGRWHPDLWHALLMQNGRPHLTPAEWVERKIDHDGAGIALDSAAVPKPLADRYALGELRTALGKLLALARASRGQEVRVVGETPFVRAQLVDTLLIVKTGDGQVAFTVLLERGGRTVNSIQVIEVPGA